MVYCLLNRFLILYLSLSTSLFFSLLRIIKGYASFGRRRYVEKILRETGKSGLDGQEHPPSQPPMKSYKKRIIPASWRK